jgi:Bacterial EndoU nuclease
MLKSVHFFCVKFEHNVSFSDRFIIKKQMFMKKSSVLLFLGFLFLGACNLQSHDTSQSTIYFSPWPIYQTFVDTQAQKNQFQQDSYNFNTPQNSGFSSSSSGQDWYQQHRQFVLSHVVGISLQGKMIKITPEDVNLINRICVDNPHKNQDELRMQLAASSAFNYAQHFLRGDRELHAFMPDIYIDPAHFKTVSESKHRIVKLEKAAKDAIEDRHKREKSQLESIQKEQLKIAKKKSKSEENKVALAHKKEWAELDVRHKQEKKHPLGIQQSKKPMVGSSLSQPQVTQQAPPQQVTQKFNLNLQEVDRLQEQNNHQILKNSYNQDRSFQQVMDKRLKAFTSSINNPISIVEHVKINYQTAAFLQVQGIDTTQFQQMEGLPIQHQLRHELVDILDTVADYAQQHQYEMYQTHLTKYCAHLASLSQQSNMQGALQQAIDGTNCCHGITHYLKGMVSGVTQAYQQFQTALDCFDAVADSYGDLILQHGAQGAVIAHGLEAIVTAGMIAAPTVTIAATGVIIGATAYVMAPVCFQALMDLKHFGSACIVGNWYKVVSDLDNFRNFISSQETVARMAELAGGAAIPTPNLNYVVDQVLSLRPVITSVQNASEEMVQSLYLMTKSLREKVYTQGLELLKLPEFINFNMFYKKICGFHFFDILPQNHLALVGMERGFLSSTEQVALTQLFTQTEESVAGDLLRSGASSIGSQVAQGVFPQDFAVTEIGKKMFEVITKPYEEVMFKNVTKDYSKLILNQASKETIELFCRCHEISIVPQKISTDIERLHTMFKDKYLGLQEFSSENTYVTMQMRHIFHPSLQPKLDASNQILEKINLNGFHHDEYSSLEQSGILQWKNKTYGKAEFGAEECFMVDVNFGDGTISKEKTFFPSNWSREKTARVIFEASQNRIELTDKSKGKLKFECRGINNMFIDIIIDNNNVITSAYPSKKNFRI